MTAFDQAWALLKMPIVPGSVRRNYRAEREGPRRMDYYAFEDPVQFTGEFEDPTTRERLPINAAFAPRERTQDVGVLSVEIEEEDDPQYDTLYRLHPRARAMFTERDMDNEPEGTPTEYAASGVNTDDEYQRRGYASALYDLASYILDRRDGGNKAVLVPSSDQTEAGSRLWQSIYEDMEDDEEPRWRLRGDLG
jgi:GNAT superfamily N-acetyltransferase